MATAAPNTPSELTTRYALKFFWPLALSWLFMSVEGPTCVGFLSRTANPVALTAAFNLLMSLALFMESPIIDLLTTATTLASSPANYHRLRAFVLWLCLIETVGQALFVLTPIYGWLTLKVMGIPPETAEFARQGLTIMIPWSAFIAWRRFHQGILIRNGKTMRVGAGTFVRVTTLITVASVVRWVNPSAGIIVPAAALICSVGAEALFAHFAAKSTIRERYLTQPNDQEPIAWRRLFAFHFPLSATTALLFVWGPLATASLAHSIQREAAMAGWQVGASLMWILRASVYALPEIVITLGRIPNAYPKLLRFCAQVGGVCTTVAILMWLTHLDKLIFQYVIGATAVTTSLASVCFLMGTPLPIIAALQGFYRGVLTIRHWTAARLYAIVIELATFILALYVGGKMGFDGIPLVAGASALSLSIELLALFLAYRSGRSVATTEQLPQ